MAKRILRVFPHDNSYIPHDNMVRIGTQTLALPPHDEIHISCTFTWDMDYCEYLRDQYQAVTDKPVLLGGGAYGSPAGDFQAGMYVKQGITFTSRGCNNHCKFCFVPEREGKIREIPIVAGNIVQDNNILQCSENHIGAVFEMLQTQRAVEFRGGLEAAKMTPFFAEQVTKLQQQHRLRNIWVAADTWGEVKPLRKALEMLKDAGFIVNNSFVQCYTISYGKPEQRQEDEERFKTVFEMGVMPRVQLFRAATREKTKYPIEVEQWARSWQRPAIIKAKMKAR